MSLKRVVYIGGFGNGKQSAERVGNVLEKYYQNVDVFTFREAMEAPAAIRYAAEWVDIATHSAGMLALKDVNPRHINVFNAPLPTSRTRLITATAVKTARMHLPGMGIKSSEDLRAIAAYDASTTAELGAHSVSNLRHLGTIASFDAIERAKEFQKEGIGVTLGHTLEDEYFKWDADDHERAAQSGVGVVGMPGIHDELIIRPEALLAQFMEVSGQRNVA